MESMNKPENNVQYYNSKAEYELEKSKLHFSGHDGLNLKSYIQNKWVTPKFFVLVLIIYLLLSAAFAGFFNWITGGGRFLLGFRDWSMFFIVTQVVVTIFGYFGYINYIFEVSYEAGIFCGIIIVLSAVLLYKYIYGPLRIPVVVLCCVLEFVLFIRIIKSTYFSNFNKIKE